MNAESMQKGFLWPICQKQNKYDIFEREYKYYFVWMTDTKK